MSLAREREAFFRPRFLFTTLTSIFTFGIWPLLRFNAKIDRWRRFELLELTTASRELLEIDPQDETRPLVRLVDDESIRRSSKLPAHIGLLISFGIAIHWLTSIKSVDELFAPIWRLDSIDAPRAALSIMLLLVAVGLLWTLSRHEKSVDRFYKSLDAWLLSRDRRPLEIKQTRSDSSTVLFVIVAMIALVVGFWWIAPACLVASAMNRFASRVPAARRPALGKLLAEFTSQGR